MKAALSKAALESDLASRFGDAFKIHEKPVIETLSTGIPEIDALTGGMPRGAISEIFGPASSGRTSLMFSMLAYATTHEETCALIDTNDVFAPRAAAPAAMDFDRLLWIRCAGNLEHAFKAADLLLHAGGFGLVVLDLGDVAGKDARRIISSWWYRFRRTVEDKPTVLTVISEEACTRSCAALTLELKGAAEWSRATAPSAVAPGGSRATEPSAVAPGRSLGQTNVLPIRKQIPVNQPSVTQGNLLRFNSIKVNRQRPISPWVNESQFNAASF
jgi:recombination protein RecA